MSSDATTSSYAHTFSANLSEANMTPPILSSKQRIEEFYFSVDQFSKSRSSKCHPLLRSSKNQKTKCTDHK